MIQELISQVGFDATGECATDEVHVNEQVRAMCAADKCHMYDKNWACPPGCGDLDFYQNEISARARCYLVQTVGELEDSFDFEGIEEAAKVHKARMEKLATLVRAEFPDALVLSAGTCEKCKECTYPDAPCRFPDQHMTSMEAAGLWVSDLCTRAGVPYNHGPNTIAYTSCVLL